MKQEQKNKECEEWDIAILQWAVKRSLTEKVTCKQRNLREWALRKLEGGTFEAEEEAEEKAGTKAL